MENFEINIMIEKKTITWAVKITVNGMEYNSFMNQQELKLLKSEFEKMSENINSFIEEASIIDDVEAIKNLSDGILKDGAK